MVSKPLQQCVDGCLRNATSLPGDMKKFFSRQRRTFGSIGNKEAQNETNDSHDRDDGNFPLNPESGFSSLEELCFSLFDLPQRFRVQTFKKSPKKSLEHGLVTSVAC